MSTTILILSLTGVILIVILLLYRQILYSTFNEEQAKVSGIPLCHHLIGAVYDPECQHVRQSVTLNKLQL